MAELNVARRRRGVAISSIKRLENLDKDFKGFHCSVIDLVEEDEEVLLEEQGLVWRSRPFPS